MGQRTARKVVLTLVIAATMLSVLLFVSLDEETRALNVIKMLAKTGSLAGVVLLFWQFLLGFRGAVARIIPDYIWVITLHKGLGRFAPFLILLHPVFITVYYLRRFDSNVLLLEGEGAFGAWVFVGMVAMVVIIMVVMTSGRVRGLLSRRLWYSLHLSSYLVLPLAFAHSYPIGMTVRQTGLMSVWISLTVLMVALYVYRVLARMEVFSSAYVVTGTRQEAVDITEISMRPLKRGIEPGYSQFAFLRRGLAGTARPFTISSFKPETGELAVTVKAAGVTTTALQSVRTGERMYVDGPYGIFGREALDSGRPIVMIAGGIGITAFKRMAEALERQGEREAVLFYGSKTQDAIAYREDFDRLRHVKVVYVLSDEPDYQGEKGLITLDLIRKYVDSELDTCEFLLCGPAAMIKKLEAALYGAGVTGRRIHHELFGY